MGTHPTHKNKPNSTPVIKLFFKTNVLMRIMNQILFLNLTFEINLQKSLNFAYKLRMSLSLTA